MLTFLTLKLHTRDTSEEPSSQERLPVTEAYPYAMHANKTASDAFLNAGQVA